ncbi:conserved hypothetical protein, partial [Ricinus communis]
MHHRPKPSPKGSRHDNGSSLGLGSGRARFHPAYSTRKNVTTGEGRWAVWTEGDACSLHGAGHSKGVKIQMGSFNVTCFASLQTIATGDSCFVLPVLQESTYEAQTVVRRGVEEQHYGVAKTHSYAHAFWTPFGGFIEARYEDGGSVELLDTPINRLRLRELFCRLLSTAAATKELDDAGVALFDFKAFVRGRAPALFAELERATEYGAEYAVPASDAALFVDMQSAWTYLETS